ncbi:MAG TPA: outer membrane protein assembly factor BamA [Pyrinomonadaceae bacterium]|nr:outer membrane protein assembly factor BamA [Pyrinomonadaceae bacterium]
MRTSAPRFSRAALLLAALVFAAPPAAAAAVSPDPPPAAAVAAAPAAQGQQEIVERVTVEGNRRLSREGVLYYVQTREGDPYNPAQVQRDLQALLALPLFDKLQTRVSVTDGARGKIVIFTVKELPIIRDITFEGMGAVSEADVLKAFREQRVGVSKESTYDPVKRVNAERTIKELLAARGYPNATITTEVEEVSATSVALNFDVNQGERVRIVDIDFEGNQIFSDGDLRGAMKLVKEAGLMSRIKGQDILDTEKLEYDLRANVENHMKSKGYLLARTGEPRVEDRGRQRTPGFPIPPLPLISSVDDAIRVVVPVNEGKIFRVGTVTVEGNSILSEEIISAVIGLKPGDVANGQRLGKALQEDLRRLYGRAGCIQYEYEVDPEFKDNPQNPNEGIADFRISITEGKQFTLRRLEFLGNTFTRDNVLRREVLLNEGDIYDQSLLEFSVLKLNQTGYFDPIDDKKDVDLREDEEQGLVDANIKVVERGRQQISFNGGLAGAAGSFFGLEYSTNNLLGRGESLSFQVAFGNRQRSFLFSFTEPYVRDRPISVGFSVFTESRKFFGEGTFLSQNAAAIQGAVNPLDFLTLDEANLFTQKSTGGSLFASSPLSEFWGRRRPFARASRVGLSYTISQSSVEDPPVNLENNPSTFIPRVFSQPSILTSRITPSFVYDTRNGTIDPTQGRQLALSFSFAGLGGDVRTYQPALSFTQFYPVRRRNSENPEVFGFRIVAGHVASFAKTNAVREAELTSLSFINGVPIFERYFLGDEFTIRGYNVRSISPVVPLDSFITSRNVVVATNATGAPTAVPGLPANVVSQLAALGTFTGTGGANPGNLNRRDIRFLGGDTQLLGNFEYRIPIVGRTLSAALFADIGTTFNLRTDTDQTFSTNFLGDDPFLTSLGAFRCPASGTIAFVSLNAVAACQSTTPLAITGGGALLLRDNRLVTREEFANAFRVGPIDPLTNLPFGFQPVFLRGEAQQNTVARFSESIFDKIGDFRSSLGGEVRIQLPVVNVPFRLIYAWNPNARRGEDPRLPGFFFDEKKSQFRFSIGRTF